MSKNPKSATELIEIFYQERNNYSRMGRALGSNLEKYMRAGEREEKDFTDRVKYYLVLLKVEAENPDFCLKQ